MSNKFAALREEYETQGLSEADVAADPFTQFQRWFDQAVNANLNQPNAMTVATVGDDYRPSARMVLLKDFDSRGFVFYTNYESRKGHELAKHPWTALLFYWGELHRQVRIEGPVSVVSAAESDAYFASRPLGSQIGASASPQSQVIANREELDARVRELEALYRDQPPPRPSNWGGYRVAPISFEFWQGRVNRLHDRLRYRKTEQGDWIIERLAP